MSALSHGRYITSRHHVERAVPHISGHLDAHARLQYSLIEPDLLLAGNVATEDVVYMLTGMGIEHNVDMQKLLAASTFICSALQKPNRSRVANALLAKAQG